MDIDPEAIEKAGKSLETVAKAADTSIDVVKKVGQLVDQAFGNLISNSIGLVGDKLAYYRLERVALLKDKVDKKLKESGVDVTRIVPINFGLPLLEKATIEQESDLQDKWASLLANAMNPQCAGAIRKAYVDILGSLESLEHFPIILVRSQSLRRSWRIR